ncbi:MAG: hypothetical protein WB791_08955, partial [Waddliaceae bacterium]
VLGEYRYLNPSSQLGYYSGTVGSLLTGLVYGGTELKGIKWLGGFAQKFFRLMYQIARTGKGFYSAGRVAKLGKERTLMREIAESVEKASPFTTKGMKDVQQLKIPKWKVARNVFPENPKDLFSSLPRDVKGWIYPSKNIRIRPERHLLKPGEMYNPRHHGQHYHIDIRRDPKVSWNNRNNIIKLKPEDYFPGSGTGFLPGEQFPGG